MFPNSTVYNDGYGVYTRCAFFSCDAYALTYVGIYLYDVKGRRLLHESGPTFNKNALADVKIPNVAKQLQKSEIDKAREPVLADLTTRAVGVIQGVGM